MIATSSRLVRSLGRYRDPWTSYAEPRADRIPANVRARLERDVDRFMQTPEFRTIRRDLGLEGPRLAAWRRLAIRSAAREWLARSGR